MSAARVLVYCAVFALGGAGEDWRHVGWSFNLAMAACALALAFVLERRMRAA